MSLVIQISGNRGGQVVPDQILPDDDNRHAGGTHVFLNAAPDQAVLADVAGTGQEHGGLVADQHMALGVGQVVIGRAVDRLVLADIDIVRVIRNVQIGAVRNVGVILIAGGGDNLDLPELLRFLQSLFGPVAGINVAGHAVFHQVHRHHGKLNRAAALDEQHLVVVGNIHQLPQIRLRFLEDLLEHLGAMAHFHDAHPAAVIVHHLSGDFLQNLFRHHGGTGRKIVGTAVFHFKFLLYMQKFRLISLLVSSIRHNTFRINQDFKIIQTL